MGRRHAEYNENPLKVKVSRFEDCQYPLQLKVNFDYPMEDRDMVTWFLCMYWVWLHDSI